MSSMLSRSEFNEASSFAPSIFIVEQLGANGLVLLKEVHDVLLVNFEVHVGKVDYRSLLGMLWSRCFMMVISEIIIACLGRLAASGFVLLWLVAVLRIAGAASIDGLWLVRVEGWLLE